MTVTESIAAAMVTVIDQKGAVDTIILSPPDHWAFVDEVTGSQDVRARKERLGWRFADKMVLEGNLADDSRVEGRDRHGRYITVKLEQRANNAA